MPSAGRRIWDGGELDRLRMRIDRLGAAAAKAGEVEELASQDGTAYGDLPACPNYPAIIHLNRTDNRGSVYYVSCSMDAGVTWTWKVLLSPYGKPPA